MDEENTAAPAASLVEKLEALDAKLREQGHALEGLLVHVAKQSFGVEV